LFEFVLGTALILITLVSAGHALLYKRDPRAALGWIVLCFAMPGVGAVIYWLLGVNRIRTRARGWQTRGKGLPRFENFRHGEGIRRHAASPFRKENFRSLLHLSNAVTRRPMVGGNRLTPLHNGERAFPEMLKAIREARKRVYLSTYIFESNASGREFLEALAEAGDRGVEVRLLIDALGEIYSFPRARKLLRKSTVRCARFLPPSLSRGIYFNLRNHRKLLVADGKVGFTGGMNIGDRHLAERIDHPSRVVDLHFRVDGPVVAHLEEAFREDWGFATGEQLEPSGESIDPCGEAFCRGISAGPNEDFEKLRWLVAGALGSARRRVRIMTPYFIPERSLITALSTTALRGVKVEIILPAKNNLPFVGWAANAHFWELLQYGVLIRHQPPPFVHSKLLLVDDEYVLIGSANLDPRSMRLNFEFNVEAYDHDLCDHLAAHFDSVWKRSHPVTMADMDTRPLTYKLRDGFCKLFSPYL